MNNPTNKEFFRSTHTKDARRKRKKIMSESFKGPSFFKPSISKMSSLVVFIKQLLKFEKQHKKHMYVWGRHANIDLMARSH
jgi:hypothetical protein